MSDEHSVKGWGDSAGVIDELNLLSGENVLRAKGDNAVQLKNGTFTFESSSRTESWPNARRYDSVRPRLKYLAASLFKATNQVTDKEALELAEGIIEKGFYRKIKRTGILKYIPFIFKYRGLKAKDPSNYVIKEITDKILEQEANLRNRAMPGDSASRAKENRNSISAELCEINEDIVDPPVSKSSVGEGAAVVIPGADDLVTVPLHEPKTVPLEDENANYAKSGNPSLQSDIASNAPAQVEADVDKGRAPSALDGLGLAQASVYVLTADASEFVGSIADGQVEAGDDGQPAIQGVNAQSSALKPGKLQRSLQTENIKEIVKAWGDFAKRAAELGQEGSHLVEGMQQQVEQRLVAITGSRNEAFNLTRAREIFVATINDQLEEAASNANDKATSERILANRLKMTDISYEVGVYDCIGISAEDGVGPFDMCNFFFKDDEVELGFFRVDPEKNLQGTGLGKAMVRALIQMGRDFNYERISLDTDGDGKSFWPYMGFNPVKLDEFQSICETASSEISKHLERCENGHANADADTIAMLRELKSQLDEEQNAIDIDLFRNVVDLRMKTTTDADAPRLGNQILSMKDGYSAEVELTNDASLSLCEARSGYRF